MLSVCYERVWPVEIFSANGELCLNCLCQPRGQAHFPAKDPMSIPCCLRSNGAPLRPLLSTDHSIEAKFKSYWMRAPRIALAKVTHQSGRDLAAQWTAPC